MNSWNRDLEKQHKIFQKRAKEVLDTDTRILENNDKLETLQHQIERIQTTQRDLVRVCDTVLTQQREIQPVLDSYEAEAKKLWQTRRQNQVGNKDRDIIYTEAEQALKRLDDVGAGLAQVIELLNDSYKQACDESDPAYLALETLNHHFSSLKWIDDNVGDLEEKLRVVRSQFAKSGSGQAGSR